MPPLRESPELRIPASPSELLSSQWNMGASKLLGLPLASLGPVWPALHYWHSPFLSRFWSSRPKGVISFSIPFLWSGSFAVLLGLLPELYDIFNNLLTPTDVSGTWRRRSGSVGYRKWHAVESGCTSCPWLELGYQARWVSGSLGKIRLVPIDKRLV